MELLLDDFSVRDVGLGRPCALEVGLELPSAVLLLGKVPGAVAQVGPRALDRKSVV